MGGESRLVTPTSHSFSGGNVVFGVSPGRSGQELKTPLGGIPIYNNVREGLNAGHRFNTGVVYLPPSGVRDGVAELIRVNKELQKIIIITEKVSVHDAREVRAIAQANHVDIIGGNCLGVADSWNNVRIGGALGGDTPSEVLLKGSVALFSNSGGFTTTIAQYLATAGWGTTTLISSGKDVYIHYSAQDFARAFGNDKRSKAAVLYVEPGGYYERDVRFDKPVVACVVGRWKSKLTRAVGHAGAMSGSGDTAEDKERWFMEMFGTKGIFTAKTPHASARGALVTSIADIPAALTKVMELNGEGPDFAATGTLALKPWLANSQGIKLPAALGKPPEKAPPPYDLQIETLSSQLRATMARQSMKDRSGATQMDAKTQITTLHGQSVLALADQPVPATFALPLAKELVGDAAQEMIKTAILSELTEEDPAVRSAVAAARQAGNAPNMVMACAATLLGPQAIENASRCLEVLFDAFKDSGLNDPMDDDIAPKSVCLSDPSIFCMPDEAKPGDTGAALLSALKQNGIRSAFLSALDTVDGQVSRDAVLAAITLSVLWQPLMRKRITQLTVKTAPWYLRLYGAMLGAVSTDPDIGAHVRENLGNMSLETACFRLLAGRDCTEDEAANLRMLIGLLVSNGPGAISAQGAKGAVSADGPQTPERVQINKSMVGFLTHTGFSHGGNGFEGIAFLLDAFSDSKLKDPSNPDHGLDLDAMAARFAKSYKKAKADAKARGGETPAIPGVHHPVFRGNAVNYDPRERHVHALLSAQGRRNVFHDYYLKVVEALHREGATPYVFCVNVDAVIAACLLEMLWSDFQDRRLDRADLEQAAFSVFLFSRMIGAAAEIDDHLNRGRNMDTRTQASASGFVV